MRNVVVAIMIFCFLGMCSCLSPNTEKLYRQGVIVCSDRAAAEIGLRVLENGGNAVDAACAVAFALAVTYPQAGNIGGGGFALVYHADSQSVHYLDFRETAPVSATAEFYRDTAGNIDRDKILAGPSAAGVPGTVAGLFEMHYRFGSAPWAELVEPARMLADTGFVVAEPLAVSLVEDGEGLRRFPATEAIFFPGGNPLASGQRLVQSDLAHALNLIELKGRDGFYLGETADAIAAYCVENGGLITGQDMQQYRPVWREPVHFRFRQLDIYCAGLPSSGGVVMGQILKMLDQNDLEKYTVDSPEYIHLFTEAARRAYADRSEYLGDPAFSEDLTANLLDDTYIASRIKSINPALASASTEILPGMPRGRHESDQTTHLITADADGNIVSLTYTINAWFGGKAVVPGYGFLLNNEMDDFAVAPNVPNEFGLTGGKANAIEGGKRMLSSMTPTIVSRSGRPYLVLGSPGGSKIITAVAQALINYHVYHMTLPEAVAAPRFHHQWLPDTLYLEEGGYDPRIIQKLSDMGHKVSECRPYGEVMGVGFSDDGVFMTGAADPRRGGGTSIGF